MSTAQQLAGETSSGPFFWSADPPQLSVDANGNLTQKTEGNDTWTYEWDAENRLKRVLKNAAEVARFSYDPKGRRVEKIAAGVTTTYTYDRDAVLREAIGATTRKYIHGFGLVDEPLAHEDATGELSFLHADGLGSIVKTTNATGAVTSSRRYDSFGNVELGATNGHAFTGREWDAETGLAYYRARYYDPRIGRFISEDPMGIRKSSGLTPMMETVNVYGYAANNPVNRVDPEGRTSAPIVIGAAVAARVYYCAKTAYEDGERLFPGADVDSQRHCYVACAINRCVANVLPGPTIVAGAGFEGLSGFAADAADDIVSDVAGVGLSYVWWWSCEKACTTCPLPNSQ